MTVITILNEDTTLPLSISQVKEFLKIDYEEDEAEDTIILRALKAAINQCEIKINKTIIEKTYVYSIYNNLKSSKVRLFYGTVNDILNIRFTNRNNEIILLDSGDYFLDGFNDSVIFKSIPSNFYRLDITYKAKLNNVNEEILQAILFHTAKIYEDKTGYCQIPRASLNIYKKYREVRV
ncbi:MAG: hypothetical protein LBG48_01380 [Rickettsiales bacterium]|jgi:uncharacterized phiE125 gp8 family phage protein|nr:hypothetical protein [Rickettsiales bacterium]